MAEPITKPCPPPRPEYLRKKENNTNDGVNSENCVEYAKPDKFKALEEKPEKLQISTEIITNVATDIVNEETEDSKIYVEKSLIVQNNNEGENSIDENLLPGYDKPIETNERLLPEYAKPLKPPRPRAVQVATKPQTLYSRSTTDQNVQNCDDQGKPVYSEAVKAFETNRDSPKDDLPSSTSTPMVNPQPYAVTNLSDSSVMKYELPKPPPRSDRPPRPTRPPPPRGKSLDDSIASTEAQHVKTKTEPEPSVSTSKSEQSTSTSKLTGPALNERPLPKIPPHIRREPIKKDEVVYARPFPVKPEADKVKPLDSKLYANFQPKGIPNESPKSNNVIYGAHAGDLAKGNKVGNKREEKYIAADIIQKEISKMKLKSPQHFKSEYESPETNRKEISKVKLKSAQQPISEYESPEVLKKDLGKAKLKPAPPSKIEYDTPEAIKTDKTDGIRIPFIKRRNKEQKELLKDKMDARKSAPEPEISSEESKTEIMRTVVERWKSKSYSIYGKQNLDIDNQSSEEKELFKKLAEQRKLTEAGESAAGRVTMQKEAKKINKQTSVDEDLEDAQLFDYVLVVSLREGTNGLEPYISFRFPPKIKNEVEEDPRVGSIPEFCFPDLTPGVSLKSYKDQQHIGFKASETFSFVLTDMFGKRHFGYCRHIQIYDKHSGDLCLPEVYCIVSPYGLFSLYAQILDEVEKQRSLSSTAVFALLKAVLSHSLPKPGRSLQVSFFTSGAEGRKTIPLQRKGDSAIHEHVDLKLLFDALPVSIVLTIVGALLLERRVALASSQLSLLSACCHGFNSLLYPFLWQHTYIPVLPSKLLDMVCLPTPYMLGILSSCLPAMEDLPVDELIIVDLDNGSLLRHDETDKSSMLPGHLRNTLENTLKTVLKEGGDKSPLQTSENKARNTIITEVFIQAYLHLIGK